MSICVCDVCDMPFKRNEGRVTRDTFLCAKCAGIPPEQLPLYHVLPLPVIPRPDHDMGDPVG